MPALPGDIISAYVSKGRSNIMGPLMRNASRKHSARQAASHKAGERYWNDYREPHQTHAFLTGSNVATANLRKPVRQVKQKKKDHPIIAMHGRRRKGQKALKNIIRNALRSRGAR